MEKKIRKAIIPAADLGSKRVTSSLSKTPGGFKILDLRISRE